jgi:hypothetical protein
MCQNIRFIITGKLSCKIYILKSCNNDTSVRHPRTHEFSGLEKKTVYLKIQIIIYEIK